MQIEKLYILGMPFYVVERKRQIVVMYDIEEENITATIDKTDDMNIYELLKTIFAYEVDKSDVELDNDLLSAIDFRR